MEYTPHPMMEDYQGSMDRTVFKKHRGKLIVAKKPKSRASSQPSEAQSVQRERFARASAYAKRICARAATRELYEAAAKKKGMSTRELIVTDYLNPPEIALIDVTEYAGKSGGTIDIITVDELSVVKVNVVIHDLHGNLIEEGDASEVAAGSDVWSYSTKSTVDSGAGLLISVTATDHPGGTTTETIEFTTPN
jgi:hypothetical protein